MGLEWYHGGIMHHLRGLFLDILIEWKRMHIGGTYLIYIICFQNNCRKLVLRKYCF